MLRQRIEQLKQEYTDQYVVVDGDRPELARFKGIIGRVKTINCSGRALVQFEAAGNAGWYDIALDFVKVVDKPEPKPAASCKPAVAENPVPEKPQPPPEPAKRPKPSPLELARKEKQQQEEKPEAAAQQNEGAKPSSPKPAKRPPKKTEPSAEVEDGQRLSALEVARLEKQTRQAAEAGPEEIAPATEPGATETSDAAEPSQEPGGQTQPGRSETD